MSFLFGGKKKTPQELMREYKRNVEKSVREIEREKTKLQTQEKKIINDIRKAAKEGQMGPVRVMAKDLVRTRAQITKFYQMKCQMQAVGLRLQTIKSTQAMTEAMKGAAKAMKGMNAKVNPIAMQRILFEFEKQSEIMDSKQVGRASSVMFLFTPCAKEMMDDAIDDAFEADDEESQVDEVIGQVYRSTLLALLSSPPSAPLAPHLLSSPSISLACPTAMAGLVGDWDRSRRSDAPCSSSSCSSECAGGSRCRPGGNYAWLPPRLTCVAGSSEESQELKRGGDVCLLGRGGRKRYGQQGSTGGGGGGGGVPDPRAVVPASSMRMFTKCQAKDFESFLGLNM
eukprot:762631-Hanusia_phi.AAC.3